MPTDHPILFFDGVCNLCNSTVDFIIRKDTKAVFKFAALQSDIAKATLQDYRLDPDDLDTVILLDKGKVYTKAEAALQVMKILGGIYGPLGAIGSILPLTISNRLYQWIAKNRYRIYGKKETCRIPTPQEKERFLG